MCAAIQKKVRAWCFTLNNPSESDGEHAVALQEACTYLVFGREHGEQGTEHLQGYAYFKNARLLPKALLPRAHWEAALGTPQQNYDYCTKDGDFFEHGTLPRKGARSDIEGAAATVKAHGMKRCAEEHPSIVVKYARGLQVYKSLVTPPRSEVPEVFFYYGPTGVGKSVRCRTEAGPDAYWKPKGEWWDGYDGEENVVLDDFYGDIPYHMMLNILDQFPLLVPFKGGFHQFLAKKIWITSNKAPEDIYDKTKCPFPPLERRITTTLFISSLPQVDPEGAGLLAP